MNSALELIGMFMLGMSMGLVLSELFLDKPGK